MVKGGERGETVEGSGRKEEGGKGSNRELERAVETTAGGDWQKKRTETTRWKRKMRGRWQRGEKGNKITEGMRHRTRVTQRDTVRYREKLQGGESGWWEPRRFIIHPCRKSNKLSIGLTHKDFPGITKAVPIHLTELKPLNSAQLLMGQSFHHHELLSISDHPGMETIKISENRRHFSLLLLI